LESSPIREAFECRGVQLIGFRFGLGERVDGLLHSGCRPAWLDGQDRGIDAAKGVQVLDANELFAHEVDRDSLLGNEAIGSHHQRADEHAAQQQKLRAGS
jgi:hypothetical protein